MKKAHLAYEHAYMHVKKEYYVCFIGTMQYYVTTLCSMFQGRTREISHSLFRSNICTGGCREIWYCVALDSTLYKMFQNTISVHKVVVVSRLVVVCLEYKYELNLLMASGSVLYNWEIVCCATTHQESF